MNRHNKLLKVPESQIDELLNIANPLRYSTSSNLFYAGQVPIVAYLLLDGLIHFTKKGKVINTFSRGNLIGLKELMTNRPIDVDAQIQPGTEVCFIDRSTVLGLLEEDKKTTLNQLMRKLIEIDTNSK